MLSAFREVILFNPHSNVVTQVLWNQVDFELGGWSLCVVLPEKPCVFLDLHVSVSSKRTMPNPHRRQIINLSRWISLDGKFILCQEITVVNVNRNNEILWAKSRWECIDEYSSSVNTNERTMSNWNLRAFTKHSFFCVSMCLQGWWAGIWLTHNYKFSLEMA